MESIPKSVSSYLAAIGSKGGRKGGKATTKAKAAAARKNGAKGGRPRSITRSKNPSGRKA